jgi:adenylate kinase
VLKGNSIEIRHRIVFLGPPGAGKGTQCLIVARSLGIPHISTGDILRHSVQSGEELGNIVSGFLDAGELVPTDLMVELIKVRLANDDCKSGFVLDGFPRTIEQAEQLDIMLSTLGMQLTKAIEICVPEEELLNRLSQRAKEQGRSDDTIDVISRRLQIYREITSPLSLYFTNTIGLDIISGLGSVEDVENRIKKLL